MSPLFNAHKNLYKIGKNGEAIVFDLLQSIYYNIKDVSEEKEYQDQEIDCICTTRDGNTEFIEIKTDNNIATTQNFPFETQRIYANGNVKDAWSVFTKADYIFIYVPQNDLVCCFDISHVRKAFHKYELGLETKRVHSDSKCDTILRPIPLKYLSYVIYTKEGDQWFYQKVR